MLVVVVTVVVVVVVVEGVKNIVRGKMTG